jgi:hypothetical protein
MVWHYHLFSVQAGLNMGWLNGLARVIFIGRQDDSNFARTETSNQCTYVYISFFYEQMA